MQCRRCKGYLITDYFMDILSGSGEVNFTGWRCLNCGDITDPVILRHHQMAPSAPANSKRRWWEATLMQSGS